MDYAALGMMAGGLHHATTKFPYSDELETRVPPLE